MVKNNRTKRNRTKRNRTKRNVKKGGNIPLSLITIPLTIAGIIGVIYYLKITLIDLKDNAMVDVKDMKQELLNDVKTMVDNEVAVFDAKIPKVLKNKKVLKEIEELESRIDQIYDKISDRIESGNEIDLTQEKSACKNTSDIPDCLKKLLVEVQKLESKYGYRINESKIFKTKALNMDLNLTSDDDSEVKAAKIAALHNKIQTQGINKKKKNK